MANRLRFRSGQVQLVKVPVTAEIVIEAGDLVWLNPQGFAEPANACVIVTPTDDANWTACCEWFLGVAHQATTTGAQDDISVDINPSAVYEFDVLEGNYKLGTPLNCAIGADGRLRPQTLASVPANRAIARAQEYKQNTKKLRVSFASAFHTGSANVHAALGCVERQV